MLVASLIALAGLGGVAYAGGYDEKDFSLRFPAALSRFSSYADVAAVGGASAGSKWQTSVNPAAVAWQKIEGKYRLSLNPQYSTIMFKENAVLHVFSESITKEFDRIGTFQLALAQVRSNEGGTLIDPLINPDTKFLSDMDLVQVQWGKKFTDDLALGLNLNYSASKVKFNGSWVATETSSDTYGVRVGGLYRIAGKLLAGVVADYSSSPSTTKYYDIFFGTGLFNEVKDRTEQFTLRLGPSFEYMKDSTIIVDYQYGSFKNDTGSLYVHRMYAGIDHRIIDVLFVRGGVALDNDGNTSWTAGVGIYPLKTLSIDLGYQYNMFPEIKSELGRSHLYTISISLVL
jgi:hypothetical protein